MRIRSAIVAASLVPASLLLVAAEDGTACRVDETRTIAVENQDGTTSDVPVQFCEGTIWAQCEGTLDPAGKLHNPQAQVKLAPTAPSVSFTEAGGCGTVDEPVFSAAGTGGSPYQFAAGGFLDIGNVDSLTFELHFLGPNGGYAGEALHLDVEATVDGVSLFGMKESPDATGQNPTSSPAARRIVVTPVLSETGASTMVRFTIDGLADLDERFADAAGGGDAFRLVEFAFGVPHTGECTTLPTNDTPRCAPSGMSGWVFGATEVPSGVTFNPLEPAEVVLTAGDEG